MIAGPQRGIDISVDELMAIREQAANLSWRDILVPRSKQLSQGLKLTETRGMEYRESRAYVVGDDFRSIDWRAMARSGEAYTKIFSDQQEQTVTLAIDLSPSLFFGTRYSFKSWTLARLAAVIGWLCEGSRLPIECLLVSNRGFKRLAMDNARKNLPRLFAALAEHCHYQGPAVEQDNQLNWLLAQSNEKLRSGSRYFLLSDFLSVDDSSKRLLTDMTRTASVSLCRITDQSEVAPWPDGLYDLQIENDTLRYRQNSTVAQNPLMQIQQEVAERINRFMAIAASQLTLSCNQDLFEQLAGAAGSRHDAR